MLRYLRLLIAVGVVAAVHACSSERVVGDTGDSAAASGGAGGAVADGGSKDGGEPDSSVPPDCEPPTSASGCSGFSAQEVASFVYCRYEVPGPYITPGFYAEPLGSVILRWSDPCSSSLAETHARATQWGSSTLAPGSPFQIVSETTTKYFFESVVRFENATATGEALTYAYRNTRCDYFDGATLKGAPFASAAPIRELAGYLWFVEDGRTEGAHILGSGSSLTPTQAITELCHTTFVHGDWGTCDEIDVMATEYVLDLATGKVTIGTPVVSVSTDGKCH